MKYVCLYSKLSRAEGGKTQRKSEQTVAEFRPNPKGAPIFEVIKSERHGFRYKTEHWENIMPVEVLLKEPGPPLI